MLHCPSDSSDIETQNWLSDIWDDAAIGRPHMSRNNQESEVSPEKIKFVQDHPTCILLQSFNLEPPLVQIFEVIVVVPL